MEYKHFIVNAFQQRPGKWRAGVKRSDGTPLVVVGPHKLKIAQSVTPRKLINGGGRRAYAIEAIDAGAFLHRATQARAPEGAMAS